jgi:hypothetical protein
MAKMPLSEEQRARMRAHNRQWQREHRDERNKQQRERYWADPEKAREAVAKRARDQYWANPEKARERSRAKARARRRAAKAKKS